MKRSSDNVLFVPDWRDGNPYLDKLANSLQEQGFCVQFADYPAGLVKLSKLASRHPTVKTLHLHWLPGLLAPMFWSESPLKARIKRVLLALDCAVCRARGIRIVWTVHNLISHESPDRDNEIKARKLLFRMVNSVIAHSRQAREEIFHQYGVKTRKRKMSVIPHGNYLGIYPENSHRTKQLYEELSLNENNIILLFFGAVRRYKGLEWLIPAFRRLKNDDYRLIIAGQVMDGALGDWVQEQSETDERIRSSLARVPEEDVAAYFAVSNAVILPFQQTLTSGSAILAMSMGRCLIMPETARVFGVPGERGAVYFKDEYDLIEKLGNLSLTELTAMGQYSLKVAKELDWRVVAELTAQVYRGQQALYEYPA